MISLKSFITLIKYLNYNIKIENYSYMHFKLILCTEFTIVALEIA
jgi:hypothetical protein